MALGIGSTQSTSPLERTQQALQKTYSRLSSLKRVNGAGDDAAALAISENLRAAERTLAQGERNFSDGLSIARTAEGGLGEISDQLGRLRELGVQAGNSTLTDEARGAIQREADAITAEITRQSQATKFNGRSLLNGDASGPNAIDLRDGSGSDTAVRAEIADVGSAALGIEGLDISDPDSLAAIDDAAKAVNATRAELGAFSNRLESGIRNLQSQRESTEAANSRLVDADVAKQSSELVKNQLQQQFQVAVQSQANISAGRALDLLR